MIKKLTILSLLVFLLPLVGAVSVAPLFQAASPDAVCIARWSWNTTETPEAPFWESAYSGTLGSLDLRTYAQASSPGPTPLGYGAFVLEDESLCVGSDVLFKMLPNLDAKLRRVDIDSLEDGLNMQRGALTSDTAREVLWEILTDDVDPQGLTAVKPLIGDKKHPPSLYLGGYGIVQTAPFTGMHLTNTEEVFQADYRKARASGVPISTLQRMTGVKMVEIYGRATDANADKLMPSEFRDDGYSCRRVTKCTTLSDSFTVASDGNIEDDVSDIAWGLVAGDIDVLAATDLAQTIGTGGAMRATAETSLGTDDHYAEAVLTGDGQFFTVMIRYDGVGPDYYYAMYNWSANSQALRRVLGGTDTVLDTDATSVTSGNTVRVQALNSRISMRDGGIERYLATDTAITGFLVVGLHGFDNISGDRQADDFLAEDERPRRIIFISKVMDWLRIG